MKPTAPDEAIRILLIDDNPGDRYLATRELRQELPAAAIVAVGDRAGFLEALEGGPYDVVI
ncbi:MAG: hybrid sensor histidine kinase/response regulator, partial [Candidatus Binatia bacterium]